MLGDTTHLGIECWLCCTIVNPSNSQTLLHYYTHDKLWLEIHTWQENVVCPFAEEYGTSPLSVDINYSTLTGVVTILHLHKNILEKLSRNWQRGLHGNIITYHNLHVITFRICALINVNCCSFQTMCFVTWIISIWLANQPWSV